MLFKLLENVIDIKYILAAGAVSVPAVCAVLLKIFSAKLPKDHGREFAVDGEKSAGKIRGAGIVFVCSFILCSLLFAFPYAKALTVEYALYYLYIFFAMLSGYLDDRSDKPWNEYKKGAIDLIISFAVSATFVYFNSSLLNISFFGFSVHINKYVFYVLGTILVWMLINAVNCSDGIDGFSSSLSVISFISLAVIIGFKSEDKTFISLVAIMIFTLIPYLWKNSEPSTMMMGDAGSRALGLFMALAVMKTGNMLLVVPLCFMVCLDGLIGIAKVSIIRFLHINVLKNIRTPLHDHFRKNKGWSNTQVIYRYCMIQAVISAVTCLISVG